jgi:polyhydroxyalkanoate synthase
MRRAAAPWTKAVAEITALQLEALKTLAAPWTAADARRHARGRADQGPALRGEAWTKDPRYEAVARTYLAQTDLMRKALDAAPIDEGSKAQWGFALQQVMDALSPANTLATNPEALQLAMETGGASLLEGMRLFTEDLAKGRIAMTDESAFEVGRNVGTTPGTVVFQNELIQLIQYTPTTAKVYQRPLVIIPPCINKYYILDLQPANSFVGHAVAEGHTVFLASWRNAGPEQGTLTWDDYVAEGVIKAIEVALAITDAHQANTLGFCIGGTLLASALAVRAARGEHPAASMTLLTTLLDYGDAGDLGLLVTPDSVASASRPSGRAACSRAASWRRCSPRCGRTTSSGPTSSRATSRARPRPRSTSCTGTATTRTCPDPWPAGTCATPTWRTSCASRAPPCSAASRSTWAASTCPRSSTRPRKTTSCRGSRRTRARSCCRGRHVRARRERPHRRRDQPACEEQAQLLDERRAGRRARGLARRRGEGPGKLVAAWYTWLAAHSGTQVDARASRQRRVHPIEEAPGAYVREKAS